MGSLLPCWLFTHCKCSHRFRSHHELTHFTPHVISLVRCDLESRTRCYSSHSAFSSVALRRSTDGVSDLSPCPSSSLLIVSVPFLSYHTAPEPMQVGDHVVTQKSLYTGLFVIGLPLLWWSSPLGTFFWLVGASGVLIFAHASLIEPGVESEYATVEDGV